MCNIGPQKFDCSLIFCLTTICLRNPHFIVQIVTIYIVWYYVRYRRRNFDFFKFKYVRYTFVQYTVVDRIPATHRVLRTHVFLSTRMWTGTMYGTVPLPYCTVWVLKFWFFWKLIPIFLNYVYHMYTIFRTNVYTSYHSTSSILRVRMFSMSHRIWKKIGKSSTRLYSIVVFSIPKYGTSIEILLIFNVLPNTTRCFSIN